MFQYREIKSDLKSKRIVQEIEKPIRWSFMKVLRETSTLKQFYPEINPYAEVYKFRDNLYCIYTESLDGAGDPWMYLIDGPEKCMLIDTGFGVGDLKGLIRKLVGDKPIIIANTHSHFDHAYGNCQFETCYCHKYEVERMVSKNNEHIWDYLFDDEGNCKWTLFDRKDIVPYHHYNIVGIDDGYKFDLGNDYIVEAILLPGHTPGQCGYYDHQNHTIFVGDITGIGKRIPGETYGKYCTVESMAKAFRKLQPRFEEVSGVFPGHGMLDQSPISLQYHLDALESILKDPNNYNENKEITVGKGEKKKVMLKYIYQGTNIKYNLDNVYEEK